MNTVLREIVENQGVRAADGTLIRLHSEILREDGEFLHGLVMREKPQVSLEIGLAYGISALYICDALVKVGGRRHIAIDPHQKGVVKELLVIGESQEGWRGIGLANLERAGFQPLVDFLAAPSHIALPKLFERGETVDFAFVDGWHTFDYVLNDFFYIDLLLRPGGVIVFDDANYPSINKVLRYVLSNRRYSVLAETGIRPGGSARHVARRLARRFAVRMGAEAELPDGDFGLRGARCVALRKESNDTIGDGTRSSRRWDFHRAF